MMLGITYTLTKPETVIPTLKANPIENNTVWFANISEPNPAKLDKAATTTAMDGYNVLDFVYW